MAQYILKSHTNKAGQCFLDWLIWSVDQKRWYAEQHTVWHSISYLLPMSVIRDIDQCLLKHRENPQIQKSVWHALRGFFIASFSVRFTFRYHFSASCVFWRFVQMRAMLLFICQLHWNAIFEILQNQHRLPRQELLNPILPTPLQSSHPCCPNPLLTKSVIWPVSQNNVTTAILTVANTYTNKIITSSCLTPFFVDFPWFLFEKQISQNLYISE